MKTHTMTVGLILAVLVPGADALAQSTNVDLHIQPDLNSRIVATVPLDDGRLTVPSPVLDEARAAEGWQYASFTDTIDAYVPDSQIGKDLFPVENALIHASPSPESTVLGVYNSGDPVEIIDTGVWWTLRLEMDFPVYFISSAPAPLPPVTGTAVDEGTGAAPLEAEPIPEAAPVIEELPVVDETPDPLPLTVVDDEADPAKVALPEVIGQSYEGIFKQSERFFFLKPKAPFLLEAANGRRIAWVDTSGIVVPGSLKPYLNQPVIIHGEREHLGDSKDWIIRARNMRLK